LEIGEKAEIEEDEEAEEASAAQEKCIKPRAQIAARKQKYRSSQQMADQFTVKIAIRSIKLSKNN
jgi:hypothetical protein